MPSIHSAATALFYGKRCMEEVEQESYYPELSEVAVQIVGEQERKQVSDWDGVDYGQWAQVLWELLPNSSSCRRRPFWLLCDLAEWYCFGDEAGANFKET
jgi:hypothetical protein